MDNRTEQYSLRELLESITENIKTKRLADVFRFISFHPGEMYGSHQHLRIEINYVKKGSCILRSRWYDLDAIGIPTRNLFPFQLKCHSRFERLCPAMDKSI